MSDYREYQKLVFSRLKVDSNGCWIWQGYLTPKNRGSNSWGYGYQREFVSANKPLGRKRPAHVVLYEMFNSELVEGLDLDHKCRVRSCVNPEHLEPVTRRENVLRGVGLAALNAAKTHCVNGHLLSGDNLLESRNKKSGHIRRACKTCNKLRMQKHLENRKVR